MDDQEKKYSFMDIVLMTVVAGVGDAAAVLGLIGFFLIGLLGLGLIVMIPAFLASFVISILLLFYFSMKKPSSFWMWILVGLNAILGIFLPIKWIMVLIITFLENHPKIKAVAELGAEVAVAVAATAATGGAAAPATGAMVAKGAAQVAAGAAKAAKAVETAGTAGRRAAAALHGVEKTAKATGKVAGKIEDIRKKIPFAKPSPAGPKDAAEEKPQQEAA